MGQQETARALAGSGVDSEPNRSPSPYGVACVHVAEVKFAEMFDTFVCFVAGSL